MNFLVDAQLPRRMTDWLTVAGCDAMHTLDLPDGNRTTDEQINDIAEREQRVVVTKDADFVDSHLLRRRPPKLLLISTGNISNRDLEALMQAARKQSASGSRSQRRGRADELCGPGKSAMARARRQGNGNRTSWYHPVGESKTPGRQALASRRLPE